MTKVAVAMSGGVDSTLAASLLSQEGHQVVGLSLRLGQGPDEAWRAGARAAAHLGLEHRVIDAAPEFARRVIAPVAESYNAGRTPNPCALCNAGVKLPVLWREARDLGCEALATGHYARLGRGPDGVMLLEGRDPAKSQAYFLARTEPELLGRLWFPLGELTKARVKAMALAAGLPAAERAESQDACFLPPGGWDELIAGHGGPRPGVIESWDGNPLGRHPGLHGFTVGQRRGLGLALGHPAYVLALDGPRAAVQVGPREMLLAQGLEGDQAVWFTGRAPEGPLEVRIRYAHRPVPARLEMDGDQARVRFTDPQRAVTPGQIAVFYNGPRVLGSVIINQSLPLAGRREYPQKNQ